MQKEIEHFDIAFQVSNNFIHEFYLIRTQFDLIWLQLANAEWIYIEMTNNLQVEMLLNVFCKKYWRILIDTF